MTEERKYEHVIWCNTLSISIPVDDTSQRILHGKTYELSYSKATPERNELVVFTCWWQGGGRVVAPPLKPTLVIIMFTATAKQETPSLEDHCFIEISLFTLKSTSVLVWSTWSYFTRSINFSKGEDILCPSLVRRDKKHTIFFVIFASVPFHLFVCPSFHLFSWCLLSLNL